MGRQVCTPPGEISFIFMQFSAKILPNNRILFQIQGFAPAPAWEILGPPLTLLLNSIAQGVSAQGWVCQRGVCPWGCLTRGVSAQGECLPRCLSARGSAWGRGCLHRGVCQTPLLWTESQTGVKTLPCRNYVADSKYNLSIRRSHLQSIHLLDFTLYHSPRHLDFFHLRFITRELLHELLSGHTTYYWTFQSMQKLAK